MDNSIFKQSDKEKSKILVLEKAFIIQERLAHYPQGISLGVLSSKVKMNKSTVYRILDTLYSMGYVVKKGDGKYRLGFKYYELSQAILDTHLKSTALPYMRSLSEDTGEIVHLSLEENNEMVFIEEVDTSSIGSITIKSLLGKRACLHATAAGKSYLSTLQDDEVESILSLTGMPSRTKNTITDVSRFMREIKQIRELGYSVDDLENEDNIRCVAAPIMNIHGECIGVLDITGTVFSVTREIVPKLGRLVKECTSNISGDLGFKGAMTRVL